MASISKIQAFSIITSSVFGLLMLTAGAASAAPATNTIMNTNVEKSNIVTEVQARRRARRGRRGRGRNRGRSRHRNRNLFLGLGAAAIIGGAIASQNNYNSPNYYRPNYYAPRPRYRGGSGYPAWSNGWYRYCQARFRSFNPNTGYYRSYRRGLQFCY